MPVVIVIGGVAIDLVTALAGLLVAYALGILLVKPLAWLLGNLPFIGNAIAQALNNGANAFMQWAQDNVKNAIGVLVQLVSATVYWVGQVFNTTVSAAEYIVNAVVTSIQRILQLSNQIALGLGNIVGEIADLGNRIAAVAGSIIGIATRVASSAVAVLEARVVGWLNAIHLAIAQAIDTAHVELGHAIDGVNLSIHAVELWAQHAIAQAVAGVQAWVDARLRPIESDVAGVKGIVDALPTVATIVGTITAVQAIEKIVEDCVKPTCSALDPSLDILNAIADGTALAEMLALVAAARSDPQGTAREVIGIADGVTGVVRTILSPAGI